MCVNAPAVCLGGDGDSVEEKFHLVYRYPSEAIQLECGECPGYLLLAGGGEACSGGR